MLERKLVRQGRNALTVTLPARWLKERGLSAGASVTIEEQNEGLSVAAGLVAAKKEITLDLEEADKSQVWHAVQGKYIEGFDRIIIFHNISSLSAEMGSAFMGMIIEEHTSGRLVLKSIISVPEDSFEVLIKRAGYILLEQTRLLEQYVAGKATLEQLKDEERLLNQNILYCMRYLNKYQGFSSSYRNFLLCTSIEEAGDQLMRLARLQEIPKKLPASISACIENYLKFLHQGNLKKANSTVKLFRDSLDKKSFADGLAFSLAETLLNFIGYLVEYEKK